MVEAHKQETKPGVELTWEDFRREFNQKFYSNLFRDQKRKKFLDLT